MNPLLARQLRKHLPDALGNPHSLEGLLDAISRTYDELESDRRFLEHTLEVTSAELNDANERLRRESEQKLNSMSARYLNTLECHEGAILRVRREDGVFIHTLCRGQLAMRLGWTPEKVEGKRAPSFAPADAVARLESIYERVWAGEILEQEYERPDGSLAMLGHFLPYREGGQIVEIIVSAIDITERKRSEVAMRLAKEKAESADKAKSEFLAVMSHEIRTPLNAVLGFTSLLQESPLTPDQQGWLETVSTSGRALLSLLNDILDFSRIEAGQLHFSIQPCALLQLVQSVHGMYQASAAEKGIGLSLFLDPGLPEVVLTDSQRFRQILVNLVSNAVKFTHAGSVSIIVSAVPLAAHEDCVMLRMEVRDSGIGIDPACHDRLFKPFSQADSSSTRQYGGTGLGLAISQRLARAMGGDITFTSSPGVGSTFVLHLRLTASYGPRQAGAQGRATERPRLPKSLRVLVAEDHPHNRELIVRILAGHGISPDLAMDGQEAVNLALTKPYDVILMDVRMPVLDGLEATRRIRAGITGRPLPRIIAVTANAFADEKMRCIHAGMDAILIKPFVVAELVAQLREVVPAAP